MKAFDSMAAGKLAGRGQQQRVLTVGKGRGGGTQRCGGASLQGCNSVEHYDAVMNFASMVVYCSCCFITVQYRLLVACHLERSQHPNSVAHHLAATCWTHLSGRPIFNCPQYPHTRA